MKFCIERGGLISSQDIRIGSREEETFDLSLEKDLASQRICTLLALQVEEGSSVYRDKEGEYL